MSSIPQQHDQTLRPPGRLLLLSERYDDICGGDQDAGTLLAALRYEHRERLRRGKPLHWRWTEAEGREATLHRLAGRRYRRARKRIADLGYADIEDVTPGRAGGATYRLNMEVVERALAGEDVTAESPPKRGRNAAETPPKLRRNTADRPYLSAAHTVYPHAGACAPQGEVEVEVERARAVSLYDRLVEVWPGPATRREASIEELRAKAVDEEAADLILAGAEGEARAIIAGARVRDLYWYVHDWSPTYRPPPVTGGGPATGESTDDELLARRYGREEVA